MGSNESNLKRRQSSRKRKQSLNESDTDKHKPHILETKTTAITDDYTLFNLTYVLLFI